MLVTTTSLMVPGTGLSMSRPRLPSRRKTGQRTSVMVMLLTDTASMVEPSTERSETPEMGGRLRERENIVQLLTAIFRKSPPDSVPSLKQLQLEARTQFVTVTFSVERRFPREKLVLGTMASSQDSM